MDKIVLLAERMLLNKRLEAAIALSVAVEQFKELDRTDSGKDIVKANEAFKKELK
jgi:hypothetical protein